MLNKEEELPCIYCNTNEHPKTAEHVLARSLGGNLTIPFVCQRCNTQLSTIDQALAERSIISLSRAANTAPEWFDAKLGGHQTLERDGLDLDVEIVNGFRGEILPQLHIRLPTPPDKTPVSVYVGTVDARAKFFALIEKQIAAGTFKNTRVRVMPPDEMKSLRLVQYESKHMLVRAESEGQARRFLEQLENAWPKIRAAAEAGQDGVGEVNGTIDKPSVNVRGTYRPDDYQRAIAKTVFNYLAHAQGAAFALRPEFDPVREYILGRTLVHDPSLGPDAVRVDTRFVMPVDGSAPFFLTTEHHVLGLFYDAPTLWGFATFYGRHSYVVRLADIKLVENVVRAHEFVGDRATNRAIDHKEMVQRIRAAQPVP